ncbi:MAG: metalloregulator ArsR/SmtB family transcription factor [Planctomycetes bacterium]|nr:metalloregulator ArsR/SmtB family transcription factor [Planctomycetota bacterium]
MPGAGDHLRLLADETRLRILHLLVEEPLTVAELQEVLDLGQSSISGHLARLKAAGLIHDVAEGSARRYRLRADLDPALAAAWEAVRKLTADDGDRSEDRERLRRHLATRGAGWVDRVAGSLHREYAPGRTWESVCHGLLAFARFGRCVDVGAGDGALVELIAPRAEELVLVDPSPAMITAAQERVDALGCRHVRTCQAGGESLPLADASADSVLFLQSLQYVPEPAAALREAARILAPGGRLLVLTLAAHEHAEAERYGHRHRGFAPDELKRWCRGLAEVRSEVLPPEPRPPRFRTLVLTAQKPSP